LIDYIRQYIWSHLPKPEQISLKLRIGAALLWGVVFPLTIGVVANIKNGDAPYPWDLVQPLAAGFGMLGLALLIPVAGPRVYLTILRIFSIFGFLVGNTLLVLTFYLMVTPVAFWFRVVGKDPLDLKFKSGNAPSWHDHQTKDDPGRYYRLF